MANRTLIVMRSFFAHRVGALSRVAAELALRMNEQGHETHILTDSDGGPANRDWFGRELTVHTVPRTGVLRTYREFAAFAETNRYDRVFLHTSVFGLVLFALSLGFRFAPRLDVLVYTRKPRLSDFSGIRGREFFSHFRRIFFRNFIFGFFLPERVVARALGLAMCVFVPGRALHAHYSRLHDRVLSLAFGMDNRFVARAEHAAAPPLVREMEAFKTEGRVILAHSGLATPFRGWEYAVRLFRRLNRPDAVLYLLLYADEGEHIGPGEIKRARRLCHGENIRVVTEPLPELGDVFSKVDIALYYYRYAGDIPECPLTLNELQKGGAVVLSNRVSGIGDMLFDFLPVLSGDEDRDAAKLGRVVDGVKDYRERIVRRLESGEFPTWEQCAERVTRCHDQE